MGRDCAGQQKVYQWCILGHPDRRALAGFTSGLWQVGTIHQRFIRWRRNGIWERILEVLIQDPDYEWLMIDASHVKVHPHAAGARGGNQDMSRTKGGSTAKYIWPWMRMVCQSEFLLQKVPELIARKLSI